MTHCIMCRSVADGGDPHPMGVLAMSIMLKLCADHQRQADELVRSVLDATSLTVGHFEECDGCAIHTPACGHPDYCCAACPGLPPERTT